MANAEKKNVIRIDTDNYTRNGPFKIESMVYVPGSGSPDANIKLTDTNGTILWSAGLASSRVEGYNEIRFDADDVMHVDLAGTGTILYLYLCTEG
jgi:hypothetical protein